MRCLGFAALLVIASPAAQAQVAGRFPPDSLVNVQVIPRETPVINVVGQMRNIAGALGVRCQYCHIGEEGMPLAQFDFASDEKRTKRAAREMMRMVQAINSQMLPRVPGRSEPGIEVACQTCHRGTALPLPLSTILTDVAAEQGVDSALARYRRLRERYYGRDAFDFGEPTLNTAAFRLGRGRKFVEAEALLRLNEEHFPGRPSIAITRGNVSLMRGDTAAAEASFREAIRRNPQDTEARGRLRDIGRQP